MKDRHRAGRFALSEARSIFQGVDSRPPERNATVLQLAVELLEAVIPVIEEPIDASVDEARHFRSGVNASEAEERIRSHLRSLAGFRHQSFAKADHDGVIFRKSSGQVPQALAHHVGADGISRFLDLVVCGLFLAGPGPELAEETRPERGRSGSHGQTARDAPWCEGES